MSIAKPELLHRMARSCLTLDDIATMRKHEFFLRESPIKFLEIGVARGGSVKLCNNTLDSRAASSLTLIGIYISGSSRRNLSSHKGPGGAGRYRGRVRICTSSALHPRLTNLSSTDGSVCNCYLMAP